MAKETPPQSDEDEFAGIAPTPRRRSPVSALVVIGLAGVLIWHLRADLTYAFRSRTAHDLGDARSFAGRGAVLEDNTYVSAKGQPDRRNALFIEPRGEKSREAFFRLLGTGSSVLVRETDTARKPKLADAWTGRLRRLDALPWSAAMREYFVRDVTAQRYLTRETLQTAVGKPAIEVKDRAGEALKLDANTELAIDSTDADKIEVLLPRDKFPTLADAQHELDQMGLPAQPGYGTADAFGVLIDAPKDKRNAILSRLEDKELAFQLAQVRYLAKLSALSAGAGGLSIANAEVLRPDGVRVPSLARPAVLPWAAVQAASVSEPLHIAADAWVLTEGEAPSRFWWAPLLAALLVAFAAFNVWYLVRRRDSDPRHPPA